MAPIQQEALKVLTIGSPLSELTVLVQKITAINSKHGPFDACIIVGDLFKPGSDGSELDGIILPVPTYFTIGRNPLPASVQESLSKNPEVVPNLVYLGKANVFTTSQGLKICAVGGAYDADVYEAGDATNAYAPTMSKASITSLLSHTLLGGHSEDESLLEAARDKSAALPSAFHGVDILITSSPPPSLNLLSPSFTSLGFPIATAAPPLADILKQARPRYLFWADGDGFWEREPWGWSGANGSDERWTRAVKLGALGATAQGGTKPARWFYATSLPPQAAGTKLPPRPANATPNPFTLPVGGRKRAADDENGDAAKRKKEGPPPDSYICKLCQVAGHWIQDCPTKELHDSKPSSDPSKPPAGYVCAICNSTEHFIRECPQRGDKTRGPKVPGPGYVCKACGKAEEHFIKNCPVVLEREAERRKGRELGPAECWFCLSNPKVTKHLIVAIGSETYVTLPKGQLIPTHSDEPSLVPGGGHVLIIPIAHHPTLLSIPEADAMNIVSELESYKSSLRACFANYGAVPVTFEVGRLAGRGGHAHIQVVPVPAAMADKVADAFRKAGEASGLDWEEEPERALARVGSNGNYFKVECPDGQRLVHLLKGNFDLQFGRMVLSGLLGYHHRANWKDCVQSDAQDKEDAQKFKKALQPFLPK